MAIALKYDESIRDNIKELVRRRIDPLPPNICAALFRYPRVPLSYHLQEESSFIHLHVGPARFAKDIERRARVFRNPFPGFFSTFEMPCLYRPHNIPYRGAIEVNRNNGSAMIGPSDGSAKIVTSCFLHLLPDTSFVVSNISLQSPPTQKPRFNYQVYLSAVVCSGPKTTSYSALRKLEDILVDFISKSRPQLDHTENE